MLSRLLCCYIKNQLSVLLSPTAYMPQSSRSILRSNCMSFAGFLTKNKSRIREGLPFQVHCADMHSCLPPPRHLRSTESPYTDVKRKTHGSEHSGLCSWCLHAELHTTATFLCILYYVRCAKFGENIVDMPQLR